MTNTLILDNLIAWSLQVCVLVLAGALAALTLQHPRGRLVFWQGLLGIALLLPLVQTWTQQIPIPEVTVAADMAPVTILAAPAAKPSFHWNREDLLMVILAGTVFRMLWIGAGLLRLRGHRKSARRLASPMGPFERPDVRWYQSDTVSGPVTFGWLRPAILLPSRIADLPADLGEAIACHELVHVGRRDWVFVLGEELIRSVLWFHPAIWFVLSRIQLAREQVVDLEVIRLTGDRTRYLEALVAVAAQRLLPDVVPAPLFLKKRQLAVRVAAVLKEIPMSKSRFVASLATVCSAAMIAVRVAVWLFPLQSPAQSLPESHGFMVVDGAGVSVDSGAPLMHRPGVTYPRGATATGMVVLEAILDAKGEVTDARVISGPDELRRAALQSVLQWHYSTSPAPPTTIRVSITFSAVPEAAVPAPPRPAAVKTQARDSAAPPPPPPPPYGAIIQSIEFNGVSSELEQRVREQLPARVGDVFSPELGSRVSQALRDIDEHLGSMWWSASCPTAGCREMGLRISLTQPEASPAVRLSAAPALAPGSPGPIRVGGNVQSANLIRKVNPEYPPLAKQARIQGHVVFNATIGPDGWIQTLELVSGHPLLVPAATEAVKQWVYKPTLLNGQPVTVLTQIDVNFTLLGENSPPK